MNPFKEALGLLRRAGDELEHCCARLDKLIELAVLIETRLERLDGRLDLTQLWASEHLPGYPRTQGDLPRSAVAQARAAGIPDAGGRGHANGL